MPRRPNAKPIDPDVAYSSDVGDWLAALERARVEEGMQKWEVRCQKIRRRYRDEGSPFVRTRRYALLWSNIQTMQSAVYAQPPHATVSRRHRDKDPVARIATEVLERAINASFDMSDYDAVFKCVRDDFLLYGRGTARIYYEPEFETEDDSNEDISAALDIRPPVSSTSPLSLLAGQGANPLGSILPLPGSSGGVDQAGASAARPGMGPVPIPNGSNIPALEGTPPKSPKTQKIAFENVRIRFVQRGDFRHQPARTWSEVGWVAFRAFMTRAEVRKRFGSRVASQINMAGEQQSHYDEDSTYGSGGYTPGNRSANKCEVWEIWSKSANKVLWVSPGYPDVLEEGEPYLDLDGFFPCPRPAYATLTCDSLVPVPDYVFYQDQAEEIDQLTARIAALSDALKFVGFYPAGPQGEGSPEIEKAVAAGVENKMIAVKSWDSFIDGQGKPRITWLPIEQVQAVLQGCVELRQQLVQDVYQIIGLSDIMRGATDPQETEGAQQLKAQFGGVRIRDRQQELVRFCRDVGRLCGQVIAQYFEPATVEKMTNITLPTRGQQMMAQLSGQPAPPGPTREDVFSLLEDNTMRRFKIDIENDSTIAGDESKERQDRSEFIQSVTQFIETWGPMVAQKPELASFAGQLLTFGSRSFRVGRELEESIEELADRMAQQPQQPQQDPKAQTEQLKLQGIGAKTQAEVQKSQIEAQTAQIEGQAKGAAIQAKAAADMRELELKAQIEALKHQHQVEQAGLEHQAALDKLAGKMQPAPHPLAWPVNEKGWGP